MVYEDRNLAYDLRLFEKEEMLHSSVHTPSKEKANHQPEPEKQNKAVKSSRKTITREKRRKNNFFKIACSVVLALAVVIVVGLIIHGQVQLTELNQQIGAAQKDLEEQQSIYTQLEMKVDASISTAVVEKYAKEELKMSKVSNSQKEFISLSQGDKVELAMESSNNVFDTIAQSFSSLWA
ncbi:MAG: septum formation initiator family protein [Ruminococcus sp.]|nr:septum formation initiator family protein [Ruminococcus sp.]